jgi:hypothetical protein
MKKDLLLHLPSRSRPDLLEHTIQTLYASCYSKDNFDILCQIDSDEYELYKPLINKYPEIKWDVLEYFPNSWYNIIKSRHDFLQQNNYYFVWPICDDSIIYGISEEWDIAILDKKDAFVDGLFMMYTFTSLWNRNHQNFEKCHYLYNNDYDNGIHLLNTHEMMPVMTKKFLEFVWEIHKDKEWTGNTAEIVSSLIYKLYKEYQLNRYIPVNITYGGMMNHESRSEKITNTDGTSRDKAYNDLIKNNYNSILPVINQMYEYIKNYK